MTCEYGCGGLISAAECPDHGVLAFLKTQLQPSEVACGLCGEPIRLDDNGHYLDEVGEFWNEKDQESVIAHAQCGLDQNLPLA